MWKRLEISLDRQHDIVDTGETILRHEARKQAEKVCAAFDKFEELKKRERK